MSSRFLVAGASLLLAPLVLVACGASRTTELPHALGERLAATADRVAADVEAGDAARARRQALGLRAQVKAAVAAGTVPAALRGPLERGAARLLAELPEPEPPPPPRPSPPPPAPPPAPATQPPPPPHGKALGKGKHERNEHGKHGKHGGRSDASDD